MREESHLDEMRTAIRGDFERLAERRGEQDLMRVTDEESPGASVETHDPRDVVSELSEAESDAEPGPERRSLLARLFSPP